MFIHWRKKNPWTSVGALLCVVFLVGASCASPLAQVEDVASSQTPAVSPVVPPPSSGPLVTYKAEGDSSLSADAQAIDDAVSEAILTKNAGHYLEGAYRTQAHVTLRTEEIEEQVTVYAVAYYLEYDSDGNTLLDISGSLVPVAITLERDDDGYRLVEYWEPQDGTYYVDSIREKFPAEIADEAVSCEQYVSQLDPLCLAGAQAYFEGYFDNLEMYGIGFYYNGSCLSARSFRDAETRLTVNQVYEEFLGSTPTSVRMDGAGQVEYMQVYLCHETERVSALVFMQDGSAYLQAEDVCAQISEASYFTLKGIAGWR